MKFKSAFIYEVSLLDGRKKVGIVYNSSRYRLKTKLGLRGYFKIKISTVPSSLLSKPLTNKALLQIINPLAMMLRSGLTLTDALEMQINENPSVIQKFIFIHLSESLNSGKDIKSSLAILNPLFPDFFKTIIGICESSGRLLAGLDSLKDFYGKKEERTQELKKITRYPKVVAMASLVLSAGVIIFIIPMFNGIYEMFGDNLPFVTKIMLNISRFVHEYSLELSLALILFAVWLFLPGLNKLNPFVNLARTAGRRLATRDDPYLYSQALRMLLENGQPLSDASKQAAYCLSENNIRFGIKVTELLNSGLDLATSFQKIGWFPSLYYRILVSAEKSGQLATGFAQICRLLEQKKEESFNRWNKYIEPAMMLLLGGLILVILLAVYLPVFDLGNQIK